MEKHNYNGLPFGFGHYTDDCDVLVKEGNARVTFDGMVTVRAAKSKDYSGCEKKGHVSKSSLDSESDRHKDGAG